MDYQNYIKSELLILVPVLYIVGLGFKKSKIPIRIKIMMIAIMSIVETLILINFLPSIFPPPLLSREHK